METTIAYLTLWLVGPDRKRCSGTEMRLEVFKCESHLTGLVQESSLFLIHFVVDGCDFDSSFR